MTESVRKPRRWPWIVTCVAALLVGFVGGTGAMSFVQFSRFNVSCPPIFEPMPGEVVFRRGPDMLIPRPLNRPRDQAVPVAGRRARVTGTAEILFYVERDGRVTRIMLGRSSGFCPYDVHALLQAQEIRFQPGQFQGEQVGGWVSLNITYQGGARSRRMTPREKPASGSTET